MAHPLDGARLKVVRAQEHLESFKEAASVYINKKPYRIDTITKSDYHHSATCRLTILRDILG